MDAHLSRRQLIAGAAVASVAAGSAEAKRRPGRAQAPDIGTGGKPMALPDLQRLALENGKGVAVCLVDLAALDQNLKLLADHCAATGWALRPALKVMPSARLSAYVLQRLPEPRGMVFSLPQARETAQRLPRGSDLMLGYPPTPRELAEHLATRPTARERTGRMRILVDSVALLEELASLARSSRRPLPIEVALELDVGMGRGGMNDSAEIAAAAKVLRAATGRLRLTAVMGYDGHATLSGDANWRRMVADTAQQRYGELLEALAAEAAGLFDPATLVRNGPASSNYRNWTAGQPANEISPGSAFLFAGYLQGFDHDGLAPAVTLAAPVFKITSDHPSAPYSQTTVPGSGREEILVRTLWWADAAPSVVYPEDVRTDDLSGGGWAMHAPKGVLRLGDPVLLRPAQTGEAMVPFAAVHAVREGTVRRVWPTLARPHG